MKQLLRTEHIKGKAYQKAYQKAYHKTDKYKAYQKAYWKTYWKAYQKTDKYKAYHKAYWKAYRHNFLKNNLRSFNFITTDGMGSFSPNWKFVSKEIKGNKVILQYQNKHHPNERKTQILDIAKRSEKWLK